MKHPVRHSNIGLTYVPKLKYQLRTMMSHYVVRNEDRR